MRHISAAAAAGVGETLLLAGAQEVSGLAGADWGALPEKVQMSGGGGRREQGAGCESRADSRRPAGALELEGRQLGRGPAFPAAWGGARGGPRWKDAGSAGCSLGGGGGSLGGRPPG